MRLPSLSKSKSEVSGQSGHALPDCYRRFVPKAAVSRRSKVALFDHLIGAHEHRRWNFEANRAGALEVNH